MVAVLANDAEVPPMPAIKRPETAPAAPNGGRRVTGAKLAAVVEAAYILEAVGR
jgi:hypothetical protein